MLTIRCYSRLAVRSNMAHDLKPEARLSDKEVIGQISTFVRDLCCTLPRYRGRLTALFLRSRRCSPDRRRLRDSPLPARRLSTGVPSTDALSFVQHCPRLGNLRPLREHRDPGQAPGRAGCVPDRRPEHVRPVVAALRRPLPADHLAECIRDELNALPYLDAVIRETMRLHAPVPSTIRVAGKDDLLPLSEPIINTRDGKPMTAVPIAKGTSVYIRKSPHSFSGRSRPEANCSAAFARSQRFSTSTRSTSSGATTARSSGLSWLLDYFYLRIG